MSVQEIEKIIKEKQIKCILLGTPDVNGNLRGRGVNPEFFIKNICDEGLGVCDCIYVMDTMDNMPLPARELPWYPNWEEGLRDYMIKPDLSTFAVVPWLDRTASVIGDVYDQTTDDILDTAPRSLLKNLVKRVDKLGYKINATTELEFNIFPEPINEIAEKGFNNIKLTSPGFYDYSIYRMSVHHEMIEDIVQNMNRRGVPIHTYQVEAGPGQFECNLLHTEILEAADRACIYKNGVKEIVARKGMTASFMAKFDPAGFGSSCHLHQSLLDKKTGSNLFWGPGREHNISQIMENYAAGLLEMTPDLTLMWAPYVNSYKRLCEGSAAGINKTWGIDNRTVCVRALLESESSCRLEHRLPGADSNPYLVMAGMLAGGLYGIEKKLKPPPLFTGNAYKATEKEAEKVPQTLGDAIKQFSSSKNAREYLGDRFVDYYSEYKSGEWKEFCLWVTNWEKRKYLEMA